MSGLPDHGVDGSPCFARAGQHNNVLPWWRVADLHGVRPVLFLVICLLWLLSLGGCAGLPKDVDRPFSVAWQAPEQTRLGKMAEQADRAGAAALTASGGKAPRSGFFLLDKPAAAFNSRLALIEAAERTLDIQSYAIHADESTEQLFAALRQAAARGVRVRLLLDDFNTAGKNASVLALAYEPGMALRLFNPLAGSRQSMFWRALGALKDADQLQRRMHNKVWVADNAMAITGGRNLGETYFDQGSDSNFIDMDVLASGPIVRELSESFDAYWNHPLAYPAQALALRPEPAVPDPVPIPHGPNTSIGPAPGVNRQPSVVEPVSLAQLPWVWAPSRLLVDKPSKIQAGLPTSAEARDNLIDELLELMSQAQHELLIVSAYVVPGPRIIAALCALRQRGVRVRMLTNSLASTDAPAAHIGYARHRPALVAMGVELYEMRARQQQPLRVLGSTAESLSSLHSKAVVIDGQQLVVGSMNLDLRSQLQNTEVAVVINSAVLAAEATRRIENTLQRDAYQIGLREGRLVWRPASGSDLNDGVVEPDASLGRKMLLWLLAPFAHDELL
jgi:phosphatidylserine/phosphatidylglycerophosphate/cardiolipin synthase-like enzyme